MARDLTSDVDELIREVSAEAIEPRFKALADHEVTEKSAGEFVTRADEDGERLLTAGLNRIRPGIPVVGEEACASDPAGLDGLERDQAWIVDAVDGTGNFVKGTDEWAVMVALHSRGATVMSWIWQPVAKRMYIAEKGASAVCNGETVVVAKAGPSARAGGLTN